MFQNKKIIKKNILYCIAFGIAVFMHFFRLGDVPYGIHIDEAGMGYDAYCLANYSVDRYLNRFPVYMINFGGGQSALYTYLTALLIKITGTFNIWIIRLPGAIIAMLAWFSGIRIIRKCMGENQGLLAAFLLAIFPYFSMQSRFGLDCNLLFGISTIGIYYLFVAEEKKKAFYFIFAGFIWGICYYTYALSYIGNTLFILAVLIYWLWHKKITWKNCFCFAIPLVLLAIPLLLVVVINSFGMPQIETPFFTIPELPNYRGREIVFTSLLRNFCIAWKDILSRDWLPYNALEYFYTMYVLSIPFAILGVLQLLRNVRRNLHDKKYSVNMIFFFLLCSWTMVGMVLGGDGPNINKLNGIFFAVFYCVLYGMQYTWQLLNQFFCSEWAEKKLPWLIRQWSAKILTLVLLSLYLIHFVLFANTYFNKYPVEEYPQFLFADTYEELMEFIESETGEPKSVYVDAADIYYFLSAKVNPYELEWIDQNVESHWKYLFGLPNEMNENCIYIVRDTNEKISEQLEERSFAVYHSGMYNCYYIKE